MLNTQTSHGQNANQLGAEGVLFDANSTTIPSHAVTVGTKPRVLLARGIPDGISVPVEVSVDNVEWFPWSVHGVPVALTREHNMIVLCVAGNYRVAPPENLPLGTFTIRTWEYSFEHPVCEYIPLVDPLAALNLIAGDNVTITENPAYNYTISVPLEPDAAPATTDEDWLSTVVFGDRNTLLGAPHRWLRVRTTQGDNLVIPAYQIPA